jgi:hypothetical protein
LTYVNGRRCRCWVGIRLRSDTDPQPDLPSPDLTGDGTDGTDGTRFSESCLIKSDDDQSFGNSCSICSVPPQPDQPDPSVTPENPTIACHCDEKASIPPSPCCSEPLEPDEEGIGVCIGCGRSWQWEGTSWHPANLWEFDPKEYGFPF